MKQRPTRPWRFPSASTPPPRTATGDRAFSTAPGREDKIFARTRNRNAVIDAHANAATSRPDASSRPHAVAWWPKRDVVAAGDRARMGACENLVGPELINPRGQPFVVEGKARPLVVRPLLALVSDGPRPPERLRAGVERPQMRMVEGPAAERKAPLGDKSHGSSGATGRRAGGADRRIPSVCGPPTARHRVARSPA